MAKDDLVKAIQQTVDKAAEKGIEVKVEIDDFSFDGHFRATITATPRKPHAQN